MADANGNALNRVVAMTFSFYAEQRGGAPLWSEVQNVQVDGTGHYTALLGFTKPEGLPVELFTHALARWLGVQADGEAEQPRVMLLSVPYALRAADAETLGGRPPSAYATTPSPGAGSPANGANGSTGHPGDVSGSGTPGYLALWSGDSTLGSASIFQVGVDLTLAQTDNSNPLLSVTQSGNNIAIFGLNNSTSGDLAIGVFGQAMSPEAAAVEGVDSGPYEALTLPYGVAASGGTAVSGQGNANGVEGNGSTAGVVGTGDLGSHESIGLGLLPYGVGGDTNQSPGVGVVATNDGGIAIAAFNKAENLTTAKFQNDEDIDETAPVLQAKGKAFDGICILDVTGSLICNGNVNAVVPVDDGARQVALSAIAAPEKWFEDTGTSQLSNGVAVVHLEPTYAQTINGDAEYRVLLTPKGECKGLYVVNETADSFEVHEMRGGNANVAFDYRIMARRKGQETVRLTDVTRRFSEVPLTQNKGVVGSTLWQTLDSQKKPLAIPAGAISGVSSSQGREQNTNQKK